MRVALLAGGVAAVAATLVGLCVVALILGDQPASARRELMLVATVAGAATVAIVTVATVLIVERMLSRSLRELTRAVEAAEKGRYLARARSTRADEIGELSRAFDRLCAQITDLSVSVIDADRELAWTRRELRLMEAISLLFELTQTIDAQPELDDLVRAIPQKIAPALGFDEMAILLVADATGRLVVKATYGFGEDEGVEGLEFAPGEGISGEVVRTLKPAVIEDTRNDPRYTHYKGRHPTDGSFACIPMILGGRAVGVFNVLRPRPGAFSAGDIHLLRTLASYTALAIAHAEANLRLRDLSVTDDLTGVANRRLFLERLGRETERARRGQKSLSALVIDLDHFKRVNDEHGHLRGDEVLRAVARILEENVRRHETVARYGGEEFVVLLPECKKPQALLVAEKLRAAVAERPIGGLPITISIGVATLPDDAVTAEGLIDAADRALFAAKRAGRNRVVAFDQSLAASA